MKRTKPNRTQFAQIFCKVCAKPIEGKMLIDPRGSFRRQKAYSDGSMHPECETLFNAMVEKLMAGGMMVRCTKCGTLGVADKPEGLHVPHGNSVLEILCTKCTEVHDGDQNDPAGGEAVRQ